jgi:hypothetical protein
VHIRTGARAQFHNNREDYEPKNWLWQKTPRHDSLDPEKLTLNKYTMNAPVVFFELIAAVVRPISRESIFKN